MNRRTPHRPPEPEPPKIRVAAVTDRAASRSPPWLS